MEAAAAASDAGPSLMPQQHEAQPHSSQQQPPRPPQHQHVRSERGGGGRGRGGGPQSSHLRRRLTHIPARQPVLVRLPTDKVKAVELHPGRIVTLGKYGSFRSDDLIGLPFGLTLEIVTPPQLENKGGADTTKGSIEDPAIKKKKANGKHKTGGRSDTACGELKVVVNASLAELEDNQATNEMIGQDGSAQTLTYLDIRALKAAGTQGKEIVQREVESNASFQQRTSWSQQKFVMRKQAKHMRLFTPIPPTLVNVSRYVADRYEHDANDKIRGLRADSLSSILSQAGVAPGRRFIVVDGVGGLLAGAMLERMGGEGRLLALNDADSPPAFDLMSLLNLPSSMTEPVLRTMNWACTDPDWQSVLAPADGEATDTTPAGKLANDRDRQRLKRRRAAYTELERMRAELFEGRFDGVVVASPYEPCSIVERLLPYLGGSSNVVVHSPHLQPLIEAHAQLRVLHSLVNVSVTEPWLRRYQVLPGRMHPEMSTSASAGYILHAIRVLSEEETRDMLVKEGERKRLKQDEENAKADPLAAGAATPARTTAVA